jgi:N6-L-threonylcarbamoyladenine synthase
MLILGIETSCDETAAAVVSGDRKILSNIVMSQITEHVPYGGVVPEIAARAHIDHVDAIVERALAKADTKLSNMDAIAVTGGPGLIGGVIVGVMMGKALASVSGKPFIAVNHLEGHALTARLTNDVSFPFLLLLISGGHCQFLIVRGVGQYEKLGGTIDDALGEAYDKTAKMLGLGYPGGPAVEALAKTGDPKAFPFSIPMKNRDDCNLSFSGLKTAVRMQVAKLNDITDQQKADICASFQYVAGEHVVERLRRALGIFKKHYPEAKHFVLAGGVAANHYLRGRLESVTQEFGLQLVAPPVALCTDNAAMIAWAGIERLKLGLIDGMDFEPRARWPLNFFCHASES